MAVGTTTPSLVTHRYAHGYASEADRAASGKAARRAVSRASLGEWAADRHRTEAIQILAGQERTRVADLVPIRHGRMAASPFAFFRGAAAVMAADLAGGPRTGLQVQLCGDAHLMNFGGFASPERDLVFDVNDFDETLPGPFEWDVKRLAASLEVAARDRGFDQTHRRAIVGWAARAYREGIRGFASMGVLDIWYSRLDEAGIVRSWGTQAPRETLRNLQRRAGKAGTKNHLKAFNRLVRVDDGQLHFVSDPPLLVPIREVFSELDAKRIWDTLVVTLDNYRDSLRRDLRHLVDRFELVDVARKVVGVGSVGTRCWVVLLIGQNPADPLFLQVKEAEASVLEPHVGKSRYANHGQRVVQGQRYMQAASDIMLGWCRARGADDVTRDFYVRQLWDWKISGNVESMTAATMRVYAQICGWTLARGHARSGDATAIAAYLGSGDTFDKAMVRFAGAYADQNEDDHLALVEAVRTGRTEATANV
ncbi:MAG TPA: DUF2252 domain-containing protein [Acidimicrobiales bacterium]|nr:DUF2252 domain-containing protein [Acidimicrobiales bacterium]